MKLTRRQLRKLIETRIKPTTAIPGIDPVTQQKLDTLAAGRKTDAMGRKFADRGFDALIDPLRGDDVPFSQREFDYAHPMVEDPKFAEGIADLFEIFLYQEKAFAADIEAGMSLEEYKAMARDFFMEGLPQVAVSSDNPAVKHSFSSGKVPYQLEDAVKRIIDPISERVWTDWSNWFANN